jgi:hypothetical protein
VQHVEITDNLPQGFRLQVTLTAGTSDDFTFGVLRHQHVVSKEVKISHTRPFNVIVPSKLSLGIQGSQNQEIKTVRSEDSTDNDYNDLNVEFSYRTKPHCLPPHPK